MDPSCENVRRYQKTEHNVYRTTKQLDDINDLAGFKLGKKKYEAVLPNDEFNNSLKNTVKHAHERRLLGKSILGLNGDDKIIGMSVRSHELGHGVNVVIASDWGDWTNWNNQQDGNIVCINVNDEGELPTSVSYFIYMSFLIKCYCLSFITLLYAHVCFM